MFFVCPQGIVEQYLEVGGRCGCRASLRHECKSGDSFVVKASEKASRFVGRRKQAINGCVTVGRGLPGPSSRIRISTMTRSAFEFTTSLQLFFCSSL